MNIVRIVILIAVLTIVIYGFQYWRSFDQESESVPVIAPQAVDVPVMDAESGTVRAIDLPVLVDEPGCLTLNGLKEHPQIFQDIYRLSAFSTRGSDIDVYRGIDEVALHQFADQGDAAAMVVIGANAVMRAFDRDQSQAIEWLNGGEYIEELEMRPGALSPAASLELNDAAYWFYQAALRGRLFALRDYGSVRNKLFGGPVGLGWISRDEYDALGSAEKTALDPANLYGSVAYDLAPQLREELLGGLADVAGETGKQLDIRVDLVQVFNTALAESDLPSIDVPATASPEPGELVARICASVKQQP